MNKKRMEIFNIILFIIELYRGSLPFFMIVVAITGIDVSNKVYDTIFMPLYNLFMWCINSKHPYITGFLFSGITFILIFECINTKFLYKKGLSEGFVKKIKGFMVFSCATTLLYCFMAAVACF